MISLVVQKLHLFPFINIHQLAQDVGKYLCRNAPYCYMSTIRSGHANKLREDER